MASRDAKLLSKGFKMETGWRQDSLMGRQGVVRKCDSRVRRVLR